MFAEPDRIPLPRRCFLQAGVAAGMALARGSAARGLVRLRVGAAKCKVTPPLSVPFLTSSGRGTHAPFQGVHDDLFARSLVLDDGHRSLAVLAVDSIGYDDALLGRERSFVSAVRQRVAAKTGLAPESVMLAATHTHSAPETIGLTPFRKVSGVAEWIDRHVEDLAAVVVEAWNRRERATAFAGQSPGTGISRHRRIVLKDGSISRRGPLPPADRVLRPWAVDDELNVVYFESDAGRPLAALLNFTAHPIVTMLLPYVSADFCGVTVQTVEEAFDGCIALFTQGAAGNVNSIKVSTGFEDTQRLGRRLGRVAHDTILRIRRSADALEQPQIGWKRQVVRLQARDAPDLAEAERLVAQSPTVRNRALLRMVQKLADRPLLAELQAMRLGPVRWVSLPGEPFVETGLALKRSGADFVVGYANGYLGYFPIRRAYGEGGYEVNPGPWSRVAPGTAELLERSARQLLGQMASSDGAVPDERG